MNDVVQLSSSECLVVCAYSSDVGDIDKCDVGFPGRVQVDDFLGFLFRANSRDDMVVALDETGDNV